MVVFHCSWSRLPRKISRVREGFFPDYEENGTDLLGAAGLYSDDIDDEMDPETEEVYEKFCLKSEYKQKQ